MAIDGCAVAVAECVSVSVAEVDTDAEMSADAVEDKEMRADGESLGEIDIDGDIVRDRGGDLDPVEYADTDGESEMRALPVSELVELMTAEDVKEAADAEKEALDVTDALLDADNDAIEPVAEREKSEDNDPDNVTVGVDVCETERVSLNVSECSDESVADADGDREMRELCVEVGE